MEDFEGWSPPFPPREEFMISYDKFVTQREFNPDRLCKPERHHRFL